eukprot:jgi/Antlo1/2110/2307
MKRRGGRSEIFLEDVQQPGISTEGVGKCWLSDPNISVSVSSGGNNEGLGKQYDEIDYIEDLLSDEAKAAMQRCGIPLRSVTEASSRPQRESDVPGSCGEVLPFKSNDVAENTRYLYSDHTSQHVDSLFLGTNNIGNSAHSEHQCTPSRTLVPDERTVSSENIYRLNAASSLSAGSGIALQNSKEKNVSNAGIEADYIQHMQLHSVDNKNVSGICSMEARERLSKPSCSAYDKILSDEKFRNLVQQNMVRCPVIKYRVDPESSGITKECQEIEAAYLQRQGDTVETESSRKDRQEVVEEIEKRLMTVEKKPRDESTMSGQIKRFYFENSAPLVSIDACLRISDLRLSTLYGKMYIKEGRGRYKSRFFMFKGCNLGCFDDKKNMISTNNTPNEAVGDINYPERSDCFLKKRSSLNIFGSRVYLVKNRVTCLGAFKCSFMFREEFPELFDITEDRIAGIRRQGKHYVIDVGVSEKTTLKVPTLEFALENAGMYTFFKVSDSDAFIRWLMAISFRQGRQICEANE